MSEPLVVMTHTVIALGVGVRGVADGAPVAFTVQHGSDVIATLSSQAKGGHASTQWIVDVGKRALPMDVTFVASAMGKELESTPLHIEASATIGSVAWTSPGTHADADALSFDAGTTQRLTAWLFADAPVDIELQWETFDPDEPQRAGSPIANAPALAGQRNVAAMPAHEVAFDCPVPAHGPMPIRVQIRLMRNGVEVNRQGSPSIAAFDVLDVTFTEPDWLTDAARESVAHKRVVADGTGWKADASDVPAWGRISAVRFAGDVELGAAPVAPSGKAVLRTRCQASSGTQRIAARRGGAGPAPLIYRVIGGGEIAGRAVTAPLHTRLRSSIWAEPAFFTVSKQDSTFTAKRLRTFPAAGGLLDDITVLNCFELSFKGGKLAVKRALTDDLCAKMIEACHKRGVQVIADLTAIEKFKHNAAGGETNEAGDAPGQRFMDLVYSRHEKDRPSFLNDDKADIAGAAKQFVDAAVGIGFDGIELDVEDGLRTDWPALAVANFRRLVGEIAKLLAPTDRLLGIANGGLVAPGRLGTGASTIPAKGSAGAQPFELAHESSNIIMRPMGYDNGIGKRSFKDDPPEPGRDVTLRALHARIADYALGPIGASGAGLSPSQFQLGVKIFVPFADDTAHAKETGQGGEIRGGGAELAQTCREVLRPRRIGVIQFSHGAGSDEQFTVRNNFVVVNRALNYHGIEKDIPKAAPLPKVLTQLEMTDTLAIGVGQPMQVPLDDPMVARLK